MSRIRQITLQDPNDNSRLSEFDNIFPVPIVITVPHHMVHEEEAYSASAVQEGMGDGDTFTLTCITPDTPKRLHAIFAGQGLYEYYLRIYEGPTVSITGTDITSSIPNDDFDSTNTTSATFRVNDTFTDLGTLKFDVYVASGARQGGIGVQRGERILGRNKTYVFYLESDRALNKLSGQLAWYEAAPE